MIYLIMDEATFDVWNNARSLLPSASAELQQFFAGYIGDRAPGTWATKSRLHPVSGKLAFPIYTNLWESLSSENLLEETYSLLGEPQEILSSLGSDWTNNQP